VALNATQLIGTLGALLPPAIAPAIAQGHGLPVIVIGSQTALMFAGMTICLTFGTNLSPRWGGCRAMQVGMVLMALGDALLGGPLSASLGLPREAGRQIAGRKLAASVDAWQAQLKS
jgi:hypothetical protein